MSRKPATYKSTNDKRSVLVVPSGVVPNENLEGVEETEIAAEISVPTDGGWGWVVLAASFSCNFILDGIFFTFGSIFKDMTNEMGVEGTLIALINSIAIALYFISGPISSALINRFGFRACAMAGSVILSMSFFCSYFATSYIALLIFYGVIAGFGGSLMLMSSGIIVGFYFERLRAMAISIAFLGSSLGIMVMFNINTYICNLGGWRIVTLFHSGLIGSIYFLAMAYRPLLSITVTQTTEKNDPTRTVTYLPSLAHTEQVRATPTRREGAVMPTTTERLFSAVSNANFPTAATVVSEGVPTSTQPGPGPSTGTVSRLTLTARTPTGAVTRKQLNQVQSMVSRANVANIEVMVARPREPPPKKRGFWARLCHWESHIAESRPMYRDDAFYGGKIEKLPVYQKSVMETPAEARTGLEYHLAVSRAVTTADLEERKGVFTTAVRRILATMMDPKLLKSTPFLLLCCSGCLTYIGLLIPYVFLPDRNLSEGVDPKHCELFVSAIGLSNAVGRLVAVLLTLKCRPINVYQLSCIMSGLGVMAYNFSFNVIYQYGCCLIFGVFIACISSVRSLVLVDLFGLDKLTNATGMLLMFQGFGSLISTPLSSTVKGLFGYTVSFYVAGGVLVLSGLILFPVKGLVEKNTPKSKDSKPTTLRPTAQRPTPLKQTAPKPTTPVETTPREIPPREIP